jgi:tetratricopeptide (TPR) repeat protein
MSSPPPIPMFESEELTFTEDQRRTQITLLIQQGMAFHQQGHLPEAKQAYESLLKLEPNHLDAHYFLGVVHLQTKRFQASIEHFDRAISINPHYADAYCNRGVALRELTQFDAAVASYDRAIAIKPDFPEAYFNRGNALCDLGQLVKAVESLAMAIRFKPDHAEACFRCGIALFELAQFDDAVAHFDRALTIRPQHAEAHFNRGSALKALKRYNEAIASYQSAIFYKAENADAYANLGNTLLELGRLEEAIASYDQAITINPHYAVAYTNRGNALQALRQFGEAVISHKKAIFINPDLAEAYSNLGNVEQDLGEFDAAIANYDKAIHINPDYADAHVNRGNALHGLNRLDEAIASYERAIRIEPRCADAYWNKSLVLLSLGDFPNGWRLYEWRWKTRKHSVLEKTRDFVQPLWLGEFSLNGKTILLHCEQGIGDTIQFCRYVKLVADLGARVVFEVEESLFELMAQIGGVDQLVVKGGVLPQFDYHCPIMSLPLAFKTELKSIPTPGAYLKNEKSKLAEWNKRLGEKSRPRIGLAWSGNAMHRNDHNRSISLSALTPYLSDAFEYVCLQKELRTSDEASLQRSQLRFFGDEILNFADTAALCDLMDVVISVDTSVAHLSGALGKLTWVLLPHMSDFRWLLSGTTSPWYESVRLYRQDEQRDWASVLERVSADLNETLI